MSEDKEVWWKWPFIPAATGIGWLLKFLSDKNKQKAETDIKEVEAREKGFDYTVKRIKFLEADNTKLTSELDEWKQKFKSQINDLTEELDNKVFDLEQKLNISNHKIESLVKENKQLKSQITLYRVKYGENIEKEGEQ